jgi:predicted secreted protein
MSSSFSCTSTPSSTPSSPTSHSSRTSPSGRFTSLMSSPHFLRNVLRADALSCIACGLLHVVFTEQMVDLSKLPRVLVVYSSEFLLAYGALVAFLSTRTPVPRPLVWLLIAGNVAWAAACMVLLFGGNFSPSALGMVYVAAQALTVLVLAELQYVGLRRQVSQPA